MSVKGLEQAIANLNSISQTAVPRASSQAVTRLKRPRDDTKRSYTVDYAAVTGLVLQTAVELDQAVTALEKNQRNMGAFLQAHGYNPETDYTVTEEN